MIKCRRDWCEPRGTGCPRTKTWTISAPCSGAACSASTGSSPRKARNASSTSSCPCCMTPNTTSWARTTTIPGISSTLARSRVRGAKATPKVWSSTLPSRYVHRLTWHFLPKWGAVDYWLMGKQGRHRKPRQLPRMQQHPQFETLRSTRVSDGQEDSALARREADWAGCHDQVARGAKAGWEDFRVCGAWGWAVSLRRRQGIERWPGSFISNRSWLRWDEKLMGTDCEMSENAVADWWRWWRQIALFSTHMHTKQ